MSKGNVIFKLNTLSILPREISIASQAVESQALPFFKLEVWLDNLLLDETHQISSPDEEANGANRILQFSSQPFRYFVRQLFNRSKVARLRLKLLRGNNDWSQSQELDAFNIVLSQYSYEYCKSNFNQFQQHSVGLVNKTFLYYRIQCEYEEQWVANQFQEDQSDKQPIIKINPAPKFNQKQQQLLPLFTLPDDQGFLEEPSDVFIDLNQLKPVYRNQSAINKVLRIKVEGSFLNAGEADSQIHSVINENRMLKNSTSNICDFVFYAYIISSIFIVIVQMYPEKKF